MPAKKKSARKAAKKPTKSFEESLWDTATKLRGSVESSDWSGATKTTREGCPQGERGGAHQYKHVVLSLIFLKFEESHHGSKKDISVYGQDQWAWGAHLRRAKRARRVSNLSDWSGATETTRQGCPEGERGGAHQHGVAGFVLANGSMSTNTKGEGEIRQKMVENDLVDCMIALPGQLFYTTQIPVCLWFLTKNKKADKERGYRDRSGETLFIDARKIGSMISRTQKELDSADIEQITDIYHDWKRELKGYADTPGLCKSATLEDMRKHDFVLTSGRYVGAAPLEDDGIPFETKMKEMSETLYEQLEESTKLDEVITENLKSLGYGRKQ